jgi:flagellum-specific peptidoglycan hydrolase FlgJ
VQTARKARWQQATALVSLSTAGAVTGFSFAHGTVADLTSPTGVPVKLLSSVRPARSAAASDAALRAAIVKAAQYYLNLAQSRSPSQMEALIWQNDSLDGADHGESCAAFASLALESGAQATGQQSWVTGGTTYPWPVHSWVDARVDPNPQSMGIISILQDAQAHNRWHPLGDGYTPQPGDWVLFDGHVEVVTKYADRVLYTIGGDSLPNFSVNAHQYDAPLAAAGVQGFVDNGVLASAVSQTTGSAGNAASAQREPAPAHRQSEQGQSGQGQSGQGQSGQGQSGQGQSAPGQADLPGVVMPALSLGDAAQSGTSALQPASTGTPSRQGDLGSALTATATIPGAVPVTGSLTSYNPVTSSPRYSRSQVTPSAASDPGTAAQQAFINEIAPGALAAQRQYGIPAAVTIAQAIEESTWGQSQLASQYNNLFGIKGTGPAGSVTLPTQEYENGQWVTINAPFRVYSNVAQSITDHTLLLATGSPYQQAMADRRSPDTFANDLTGVYATDPTYGSSLISLMRQYNLYRFDTGTSTAGATSAAGASGQNASVHSASAAQSTARQNPVSPGSADVNAAGPGSGTQGSGQAIIPGLDAYAGTAATGSALGVETSAHVQRTGGNALRAGPRNARISTRRYVAQMPRIVTTDFITTAKGPLLRAKPLYQDVAAAHGIRWELLAACDWMQCQAQPRVSPVHGERLGNRNADGTVYRTKSAALDQVASDLVELASVVYGVNLRQRLMLSIRDLANVFAAFRWGGLLKAHRISAMEFPYSVEGLTAQHMKMRWPDIGEAAPDKPGTRFRMSFGAVPVVLGLSYPAIA